MKARKQKARVVAMRAKRPTMEPWTSDELLWLNDTIEIYAETAERAHEWLLEAARAMDAQPVPTEGRMYWDGEKMHGGPT